VKKKGEGKRREKERSGGVHRKRGSDMGEKAQGDASFFTVVGSKTKGEK